MLFYRSTLSSRLSTEHPVPRPIGHQLAKTWVGPLPSNCHPLVGQHWSEPKLAEAHFFSIKLKIMFKDWKYTSNSWGCYSLCIKSYDQTKFATCAEDGASSSPSTSRSTLSSTSLGKIMSDLQMEARCPEYPRMINGPGPPSYLIKASWASI